jgi:hypothetical protein
MGDTTIDGAGAAYRFDGVYTDVTAVPEPSSVALLMAGLGLLGTAARRRAKAPDAGTGARPAPYPTGLRPLFSCPREAHA